MSLVGCGGRGLLGGRQKEPWWAALEVRVPLTVFLLELRQRAFKEVRGLDLWGFCNRTS